MVKVALLLTGQLRTWNMCKIIVDKLKRDYDIDIFLSIDANNLLQNEYANNTQSTQRAEIDAVIKYFLPKDIFISYEYSENDYISKLLPNKKVYTPTSNLPNYVENIICGDNTNNLINIKQLFYNNNCQATQKYDNLKLYKKIFEQYYIVYKAYELLEKYIETTSTNYDLIIRLRFDQFIWNTNNNHFEKYNFQSIDNDKNKILFNQYNITQTINNFDIIKLTLDNGKDNTIQVFGGGCYKYYAYVNDQFWCHKMDLLLKMKDFYNKLPDIINECKTTFYPEYGCWIEHFFCKYLVQNNIIIEKSILDGVFIRQKYT
jgi:hypothetical protein